MPSRHEIEIEKLERKIEAAKKRYRAKKEELEYADNTYDEGFILDELAKQRALIAAWREEIIRIREDEEASPL